MKFSVFQLSRKGGRPVNEDRMGYCYTREAALFLLADGMGGHPQGEVAAELAMQMMAASFQAEAQGGVNDPAYFLATSLLKAHRHIQAYANARGMPNSPRTTLVAALIQHGQLHWIHCGDSRLYVVRDGELLTRTRDHSYADRPADGAPAGAKLGDKSRRNVLFTCLGSLVNPVYELAQPLGLQRGDRVLLCSDGLWNAVPDADIVHTLDLNPVSQAVPTLVTRALAGAGSTSDNVTALALEWESPGMPVAIDDDPSAISTESLRDGVFASTVHSGVPGDADEELDEDTIERSIAEINEAIRRSAARRNP